MIMYPPWWREGVRVIGEDGTIGTLGSTSDGGWAVHIEGEEGDASYIINPQPYAWAEGTVAKLSEQQLRRVCYEADRALLLAFGAGGIPEYNALPDSQRLHDRDPRPTPTGRSELDGLRQLLVSSIRNVLGPHVE